MICPYVLEVTEDGERETYEYDSDGKITSIRKVCKSVGKMFECAKEDCAKWCDGKCSRK